MPLTEISQEFFVVIFLSLLIVVGVIGLLRSRREAQMLRALLGALEQPLLFYDSRQRLVYCSPGIVLFDRAELRRLGHPPTQPAGGSPVHGEMVIDSNRYRYLAKPLEYKPGKVGTLISLVYLGAVNGRQT